MRLARLPVLCSASCCLLYFLGVFNAHAQGGLDFGVQVVDAGAEQGGAGGEPGGNGGEPGGNGGEPGGNGGEPGGTGGEPGGAGGDQDAGVNEGGCVEATVEECQVCCVQQHPGADPADIAECVGSCTVIVPPGPDAGVDPNEDVGVQQRDLGQGGNQDAGVNEGGCTEATVEECQVCCVQQHPGANPMDIAECVGQCTVVVPPGADAGVAPNDDAGIEERDLGGVRPDVSVDGDSAVIPDARVDSAVIIDADVDSAVIPDARVDSAVIIDADVDSAVIPDARVDSAVIIDADVDSAVIPDAFVDGSTPDTSVDSGDPDAGDAAPADMGLVDPDAGVSVPDMGGGMCNAEQLLGEGATAEDVCTRRLRDRSADYCSDQEPSVPVVDSSDWILGPDYDCESLIAFIPDFLLRQMPNWMVPQGSFKLQLRMETSTTQSAPQCPDCVATDEAVVRNDLSFDFCGALKGRLPFNQLTGQATISQERQHSLECETEEGCLLKCGRVTCTTDTGEALMRVRNEVKPSKRLDTKFGLTVLGFGVEVAISGVVRFDVELKGSIAKSSGRECADCEHIEANFSAGGEAAVTARLSVKAPSIRTSPIKCRRCATISLSYEGHSELNEPGFCGDQPSCGEVAVEASVSFELPCNCIDIGFFRKCLSCSGSVGGRGALGNCQDTWYEPNFELPGCRTCRRP